MLQDHPDLVKDQFWDEDRPEMPYTLASEEIKLRHVPAADSTALFEVNSKHTIEQGLVIIILTSLTSFQFINSLLVGGLGSIR